MYINGIQQYRKTKVITADPGKLVIMCYEGAIDNLKLAKQHYTQKNYEGKAKALQKAMEIINELMCSLDFEKGGSVARNLKSLYLYMTRRLLQADLNKNIDGIEEVIGMLSELLGAWEDVFAKQGKKIAAGIPAYYDSPQAQSANFMRT